MGQRLEVVTSAELRKRTRLLCIFFWPFALLGIVQIVHDLRRGQRFDEWAFMIPLFLICAAAPFFLYALRYREIHIFDEEGVTLRTGKRYRWDRFVRIESHRRRHIGHNHYEVTFEDGRCAIADLMADNYQEVRDVVAKLEAGTNPFTGAPLGKRS
jgi:hypothetical protein